MENKLQQIGNRIRDIRQIMEISEEEMAKMASLNQEKRYFNMTYQQIKDWMENYEIWD